MGHITPLIAIINHFKDKHNFIYFGLKGGMEEEVCKREKIQFHPLVLKPFNRKNILSNIKTFYLILKERKNIIKSFKDKPNVIISTGGFVSIPLLFSFKKCKKILLESNSTMGLANKLILNICDHLAVNFPTINNKKTVHIGNPIKLFKSNFDDYFFYLNKELILFIGGSNGAFEIVKAAYDFNLKYPDVYLMVITGEHYFETFKFNDKVKVYKRINNVSGIFEKFKLIVSRSGAATITELLLAKSLFVLIPSHNVTGNHQVLNAKYLDDLGICEVVYDIKDGSYLDTIYFLYKNDKLSSKYFINREKLISLNTFEKLEKLFE